jgi:hypothetical protein
MRWLRRNRRAVTVIATFVLTAVAPWPGFFFAGVFWQSGVHDLDSTAESLAFMTVMYGVSAIVWWFTIGWLLRNPETADVRRET